MLRTSETLRAVMTMNTTNTVSYRNDAKLIRRASEEYRAPLICVILAWLSLAVAGAATAEPTVDLVGATVVVRAGQLPKAEQAAAQVLVEELEKRTHVRLPVSTSWPGNVLVVAITSGQGDAKWGHRVPQREGGDRPEMRAEGYRVVVQGGTTVWVVGADPAERCSAWVACCG